MDSEISIPKRCTCLAWMTLLCWIDGGLGGGAGLEGGGGPVLASEVAAPELAAKAEASVVALALAAREAAEVQVVAPAVALVHALCVMTDECFCFQSLLMSVPCLA